MKRFIPLLICACVLLSTAGCSDNKTSSTNSGSSSNSSTSSDVQSNNDSSSVSEPDANKEVSITDGIYEETKIGMKTFYRFNEDGTYYAFFFDGGIMEAGTYEILDQSKDYREEQESDEGAKTLTAPQTIVTTSYAGKVTEIAYADDTLQDCNLGGMSSYRFLHHNAEYPYDPATDEQAIVVYTFYADNAAGNTLTLYHNRTFVDYTGDVGKEGTWEKISDTEFTLTDEDGNAASLIIDGKNAKYGDKELADSIIDENAGGVINTYRVDAAEVGLPMTVGIRIDCYDDATCKLIIEVAEIGAELLADEGTYELDATVFTPTFHFNSLGDIVSTPDYANATPTGIPASIELKGNLDVPDGSGNITPMTFDCVLTGTASPDAVPNA